MPQMAPISWLILFIVFLLCLLLFSVMNYFSYTPKIMVSPMGTMSSCKSPAWKW